MLEVLVMGGRWIRGMYEWTGAPARWPGLRIPLGGDWERDPDFVPDARTPCAVLALHPSALCRFAGAEAHDEVLGRLVPPTR